jgi:hypothetical protein
MDVPIGVGSLAPGASTSIARKRWYVANMPVQIAASMEIISMFEVTIESSKLAEN